MRGASLKLLLIVPALLAALLSCGNLSMYAGSVTEDGNVTGMVVDTAGAPVANVTVSLLPALHDPVKDPATPDSLVALTDNAGRFRIAAPADVMYNVEAVRLQAGIGLKALTTGIAVSPHDTAAAPLTTLRRPGYIKVYLPDENDTVNSYVYLPGTTLWSGIRNHVSIIAGVPAGFIPAVYSAKRNDTAAPRVIQTNLGVASGDTTTVADYHSWNYSRSLYLNTTASGANVTGTVTNFPVLVRLNASNFVFGQATSDGSDVRFAKADGTPLPFEIELWDASTQKAEIWMNVDTVRGNSNSQYIMMYWGASAASASSSAAVFDTAKSFQVVWHLGETGNSVPGGYKDATANAFNGTGSAMMQTGAVDGVIGTAQRFIGDSTFITGPVPSKISGNTSFTVSFWMNYTPASKRQWVVYFGKDTALKACHFLINADNTTQFGIWDFTNPIHMQNVFDISGFRTAWAFVTLSYDAGKSVLTTCLNGVRVDEDTISSPDLDPAGGLHIGKQTMVEPMRTDDTGYDGMLDELRICNTAASPDWIRLCYESQKPNATLLTSK
jgi:hypothetical protein